MFVMHADMILELSKKGLNSLMRSKSYQDMKDEFKKEHKKAHSLSSLDLTQGEKKTHTFTQQIKEFILDGTLN